MAITATETTITLTEQPPISSIEVVGGETIDFADFNTALSDVSDKIAVTGFSDIADAFARDYILQWNDEGTGLISNTSDSSASLNASQSGTIRIGLTVTSEGTTSDEVFVDVLITLARVNANEALVVVDSDYKSSSYFSKFCLRTGNDHVLKFSIKESAVLLGNLEEIVFSIYNLNRTSKLLTKTLGQGVSCSENLIEIIISSGELVDAGPVYFELTGEGNSEVHIASGYAFIIRSLNSI